MNILKNYKILKQDAYEEYPSIEIRYSDSVVFENLPICAVPFVGELKNPMLVGINQRGIASVEEREKLIAHLQKNTQKVYFVLDEKNQPQISKTQTDIFMRLPITENPEKYLYDYREGHIYVIANVDAVKGGE